MTLRSSKLLAIGYDFADAPQVGVTIGSGIVQVPHISVSRTNALGQERLGFSCLAHALPPTSTIDGVLRLDFMRNQRLTIDLRMGQFSLI